MSVNMSSKPPHLRQSIPEKSDRQVAQKIKLLPYAGFFTIGYILASALFMMLLTQWAINPQLITVLSILVGAFIAIYKFTKHQKRGLTSHEMNRLTVVSVSIVWLFTFLYSLGLWWWLFDTVNREIFLAKLSEQPLPLLSAIVMIVILTLLTARLGILIFNRLLAPK